MINKTTLLPISCAALLATATLFSSPIAANPANNEFANRTALTSGSTTASGSNVAATGETGEPDHAGVSAPLASVWWAWEAPDDGRAIVSTAGSDFDTTLAVYVGTSVNALTEVAANDDFDDATSQATFAVSAGVTYLIAVDGYSNNEGSIELEVLFSTSPANDDFVDRIDLISGSISASGSNVGATGEASEPDHAAASSPLGSVWWSWEAPIDGQLTVSTAGSDFDTTLAAYVGSSVGTLTEVVANDDYAGLTSQVTFSVSAGVTYALAVDGYSLSEGAISLQTTFVPDTQQWSLARTLESSTPGPDEYFGGSVSVSGDRVLVGSSGAERAYLFDAATGTITQTFDNPFPGGADNFASAVSVSGGWIVIGAAGYDSTFDDSGRAYLFDAVTGNLVYTFENPSPDTKDWFGRTISIDGDLVLIGAYGDNNYTGRAYLYDAQTGGLLHTFDHPSAEQSDYFGDAVSIAGNRVLIGAWGDNTPDGNARGSAFLFDATTGNLLQTFDNPAPTIAFYFGYSVSIAGDQVAIGAWGSPTGGPEYGRAYLFDAATGSLVQTFLNPMPEEGDLFGRAVSVSSGGVLIGDDGDPSAGQYTGRAYLIDPANGNTLHTFENPSPSQWDWYGRALSFNGPRAVIGASGEEANGADSGRAYLYERDSDGDGISDPTETITNDADGDGIPDYLELDSDANGIVDADEVGDPTSPTDLDGDGQPDFQDFDNDGDGVYDSTEIGPDPNNPYDWDLDGVPDYIDADSQAGLVSNWPLTKIFDNPSPGFWEFFGGAVSINGDRVLIGATGDDNLGGNSGIAHLFDAVTGEEVLTIDNPDPDVEDYFGNAVDVSGDRLLVAAYGDGTDGERSGRVYLFDAVTGNLLQTFANPFPDESGSQFGDQDYFGFAVSMDGNRVLIGSLNTSISAEVNSGRAYLFDAQSGALVHTFDNPSPGLSEEFGSAVSISDDRILIGARGDESAGIIAGRAFLYDAVSGNLIRTFENPFPDDFDDFGDSVSVSGNRVLVGAPWDNSTDFESGQAYLFDAETGALLHILQNPAPGVRHHFGTSVSLAGNRALVGMDEFNQDFTGLAYLFDAETGNLLQTFDNPSNSGQFGQAVSMTADRALVGHFAYFDSATGNTASGRAYLFALDTDGDGIADYIETTTADTDGDGMPDYLDLDSDANGIPDADELGDDSTNPADGDGNGVPDFQDFDNDGDGVLDSVEIGPDPNTPYDWDLDGIPDFNDTDSQGGVGGGDIQPDPLNQFAAQTAVPVDAYVISNAITVTGINEPATVSVVDGDYARNCQGSWNSGPGLLIAGDTVCVRQRSAATFSAVKSTVLSVGSPPVTSTFTTTTTADNEPDAYSFVDQPNATLGAETTSNAVTISGIVIPAPISVEFGEYSIGCTADFTTAPGTINNGQTVCVRHVNQVGGSSTILTVGGVNDVFSSTIDSVVDTSPTGVFFFDETLECGIPPDPITLEYPPGYECPEALNFPYETPERTVSSINVPVLINISPGSVYSIGCYDDGPFDYTDQPGFITNGQTLCITHVTPSSKPYGIPITVSVGDLVETFNLYAEVTQNVADTTPDPFNFPDQSSVSLTSLITSQEVPISGLDTPVQISISSGSGEYSINCSGAFTSSIGSIESGQNVCVRHVSAATPASQIYTELKIGKGKGRFYTTTEQDSDGDGIPDSVELANGLNPQNSADALEDADDDLRSNLDEYLDGGQINVADTGDVSGDQTIDVTDLLLMQRHLAGPPILDTQAISRGDYDRDDALDLHDLLSLQKLLTGQ